MSQHYYSQQPEVRHDRRTIDTVLRGKAFASQVMRVCSLKETSITVVEFSLKLWIFRTVRQCLMWAADMDR